MKIIDRYIAKNFLIGYVISFSVLMGLRIIIDLFVNLDEFTEHADLNAFEVAENMLMYYGTNASVYFRDFAGMITVVAAVFSLGKMVRNNELVAMMASGVSLKRIIVPIIILAILLTGLLVVDQELIIPPLSDKLVREHEDITGDKSLDVWFISDQNGSLICSPNFNVKEAAMYRPTIILRDKIKDTLVWSVRGKITAEKAVYNYQTRQWDLIGGLVTLKGSSVINEPVEVYASDVTPEEIPIRRQARYKTLLSSKQLSVLAAHGTKVKDLAQLYSQKHFRITDPIMNLIMLLVALPVLVCRDPKTMKSAVLVSFTTTAACLVSIFICKMLATEVVFDRVVPELWAWLPVIIFAPIAFIQLDSMKT